MKIFKDDKVFCGSITTYNMEIRQIYHDLGAWIINQSYWYPDKNYTLEEAISEFIRENNIKMDVAEFMNKNNIKETI